MKLHRKTMKEKYMEEKITLLPCCDIFIPMFYTVMCVHCRKRARGRTLRKALEKWNAMEHVTEYYREGDE